jgi:hypothetical protein
MIETMCNLEMCSPPSFLHASTPNDTSRGSYKHVGPTKLTSYVSVQVVLVYFEGCCVKLFSPRGFNYGGVQHGRSG